MIGSLYFFWKLEKVQLLQNGDRIRIKKLKEKKEICLLAFLAPPLVKAPENPANFFCEKKLLG